MTSPISIDQPPFKNSIFARTLSEHIKKAARSTEYQGLLALQGYLMNLKPGISPRGRLILKLAQNLTFEKPISFFFLTDQILQTIKRIMTESGYRLRCESHFEKNLAGRDILLILRDGLIDLLYMYKSKVIDLHGEEKNPSFYWKKAVAWASFSKIRERIKSEPLLPLFFEKSNPVLSRLKERIHPFAQAELLADETDGLISVSAPSYPELLAIEKENHSEPEENLSTLPSTIMATVKAFLDSRSWQALADVHSKWSSEIRTKKPGDLLSVFRFQFKKNMTLLELRQYSPFFTTNEPFSLVAERMEISCDELKSIIDRFPNIKGIDFRASPSLTDDHLALLRKLPRLQTLDLTDTNITDEGLKHVGNLFLLEILSLQGCFNLTPTGLSHLRNLFYLDDLNLSYISLQNAELDFFNEMISLEHLNLSRCELTDHSLLFLEGQYNLRTLDLGFNDKLTDTSLTPLAKLFTLKSLFLTRTQITDEGIDALTLLNNLEFLSINCCRQITDRGVASLVQFYSLKSLDLSFCHQVTDQSIDPLTQLHALQEINITRTQISIKPNQILARGNFRHKAKVTFDELKKCGPYFTSQIPFRLSLASRRPISEIDLKDVVNRFPNISAIDASCTSLTDIAFTELGRLTQLKSLNLANCERLMYEEDFAISSPPSSHEPRPSNTVAVNADEKGWIDRIENHKDDAPVLSHSFLFWKVNLETLNLSQCSWISDDDLVHLIGPNLQDINLEGCALITDKSLSLLAEKAQPWRLNLRGCSKITDTGAEKIAAMRKLHTLDISYTQISDRGVSYLTSIATLRKLNLTETKITNSCLRILINLPELTDLNLSQTQISDEALDQVIEMANLRTLDLSRTKITDAGVGFFSLTTQLLKLNVSGTALSKSSLEFLAEQPHLKKLHRTTKEKAPMT